LPVIRRRTGRCVIRPDQITEFHANDPVIAIDWPRPDLRIATMELLIGLLTTSCPPEDFRSWRRWWHTPPEPTELNAAFAPLTPAFDLDGDGPRFLQDYEDLRSSNEPIERLLIEAPGDSTVGRNTDLLVHRGQAASLGRPAAAAVLYTFQSWSPSGGAGNRTGLRGGGPLTTIMQPGPAPTLWQTVWANVPPRGDWDIPSPADLPLVFSWLAPTMTSEGSRIVTPQNAHPLQCCWGMPRRIRLDFTAQGAPRPCDLTGVPDNVHVTGWRQRPHGVKYAAWGRAHPLTPHYRQKTTTEWLAVHPQPGGIGYRDWVGLVLNSEDGLRVACEAVTRWTSERGPGLEITDARLVAAGFDMDNMKARAFVESEMPLPAAPNADGQRLVDDLARTLVKSADQVANLLRGAVRNALFSSGAKVNPDAAILNTVRERLWEQTETAFFTNLEQTARNVASGDAIVSAAEAAWQRHLLRTALTLFDEAAPLTPDCRPSEAQRIAAARRFLGLALAGYGKAGNLLFTTLHLPAPETKEARTKRRAA
jgi:CRISPR system Cascade subunit CasA